MQSCRAQGTWSRWAGTALLGAGLGACACTMAATAHADAAGPASTARPVILLVVPEGDGTEARERAATTIAAHVRQLAVDLAVVHEPARSGSRRTDGEPGILARAKDLAVERRARGVLWIGAGTGDFSLYLYASEGERLFSRRVPIGRGQRAAAVESLALIAQSASAELLEGKVAAMAPVAPVAAKPVPDAAPPAAPPPLAPPGPLTPPAPAVTPAPAPVPAVAAAPSVDEGDPSTLTTEPPPASSSPPASSPPSRLLEPEGPDHVMRRSTVSSIALAAGYVGNSGTRGVAWQNAFALEAGWHPTAHGTLGIGYEIALPDAAVPGAMTPVLTSRHPLFLFGSYRLLLSPRWDLDLGGRAVVDFVTHASVHGFAATDPMEVRGSLGPSADIGLRLLPALRLGLLVGMDVVLNPPPGTPMHPSAVSDRLRLVSALGLQIDLEPAGRAAPKVPRITASR